MRAGGAFTSRTFTQSVPATSESFSTLSSRISVPAGCGAVSSGCARKATTSSLTLLNKISPYCFAGTCGVQLVGAGSTRESRSARESVPVLGWQRSSCTAVIAARVCAPNAPVIRRIVLPASCVASVRCNAATLSGVGNWKASYAFRYVCPLQGGELTSRFASPEVRALLAPPCPPVLRNKAIASRVEAPN